MLRVPIDAYGVFSGEWILGFIYLNVGIVTYLSGDG